MKIQEAIESGLPFKRKGWKGWNQPAWKSTMHIERCGARFTNKEDILADDWEVKTCCCSSAPKGFLMVSEEKLKSYFEMRNKFRVEDFPTFVEYLQGDKK